MDLGDLSTFFLQLEGPYKWYVMALAIAIITALVTRFIFKTLKWFFIIVALGLIGLAIYKLLSGVIPLPIA